MPLIIWFSQSYKFQFIEQLISGGLNSPNSKSIRVGEAEFNLRPTPSAKEIRTPFGVRISFFWRRDRGSEPSGKAAGHRRKNSCFLFFQGCNWNKEKWNKSTICAHFDYISGRISIAPPEDRQARLSGAGRGLLRQRRNNSAWCILLHLRTLVLYHKFLIFSSPFDEKLKIIF